MNSSPFSTPMIFGIPRNWSARSRDLLSARNLRCASPICKIFGFRSSRPKNVDFSDIVFPRFFRGYVTQTLLARSTSSIGWAASTPVFESAIPRTGSSAQASKTRLWNCFPTFWSTAHARKQYVYGTGLSSDDAHHGERDPARGQSVAGSPAERWVGCGIAQRARFTPGEIESALWGERRQSLDDGARRGRARVSRVTSIVRSWGQNKNLILYRSYGRTMSLIRSSDRSLIIHLDNSTHEGGFLC